MASFHLCNPLLEAKAERLLSKGLVSIKPMKVIKTLALLGV